MSDFKEQHNMSIDFDGTYPPTTIERVMRILLGDKDFTIDSNEIKEDFEAYRANVRKGICDKPALSPEQREGFEKSLLLQLEKMSSKIWHQGIGRFAHNGLMMKAMRRGVETITVVTPDNILVNIFVWGGIDIYFPTEKDIFLHRHQDYQGHLIREENCLNVKLFNQICIEIYNGETEESPLVSTLN